MPALDFVSADGKAAGFNTALLAELGKRLQKNIEVIDIDKPQGVELSEPYFQDEIVHITLKK